MRFLFASDSFKGTLSSADTASLLSKAAHEVLGDVHCKSVIMADGGEGTVDAVVEACGGTKKYAHVSHPLEGSVTAYYGLLPGRRAIIEMAAASGLPLVPENLRNPMNTSTYGTGQLIKDALNNGVEELYVAIGGSATNDGGMGCLSALGVRFLDAEGMLLVGRGRDLCRVAKIDASQLDVRLAHTKVTVMCDVDNPLCGRNGATYVYGRQKGATSAIAALLESGMCNYRDRIIETFNVNPDHVAGAGAAGGLGAALLVFLKAKLQSGIETVLQLSDFDNLIRDVDCVITGEGRADAQSCQGKVMQGVGSHCKTFGLPVIGLVGSKGEGAEKIMKYGVTSLFAVTDYVTLAESMSKPRESYHKAALNMFRSIKQKGQKT